MRTRPALAAALTGAVSVGGIAYALLDDDPTPTFCTMALAIREIPLSQTEIRTVALEDQGAPGRDECDTEPVPDRRLGFPVLGFDCSIREANGSTLATIAPNRPDGTCGQADTGATTSG